LPDIVCVKLAIGDVRSLIECDVVRDELAKIGISGRQIGIRSRVLAGIRGVYMHCKPQIN
jgi:hypothetical protein